MIQPPQHFIDFFTSPLVYYIALASLAASLIFAGAGVFDFQTPWPESEGINSSVDSEPAAQGEKFDFCVYYVNTGPDTLEVLEGVGTLIYILLFMPSVLGVVLFAIAVKALFPTVILLNYPPVAALVFFYFNTYYWITITYAVSSIHYSYRESLEPETPLSILKA